MEPGGFCSQISLVWVSPASTGPGRGKAVKRAQFSQAKNGFHVHPPGRQLIPSHHPPPIPPREARPLAQQSLERAQS